MDHPRRDDSSIDTSRDNVSLSAFFRRRVTANRNLPYALNPSQYGDVSPPGSLLTSPSSNSMAHSFDNTKPSKFNSWTRKPASPDDDLFRSDVNAFLNKRARRYTIDGLDDKIHMEDAGVAGGFIMRPDHKIRRYWDIFILLLLIYVAFVSVFIYSFFGVLGLESPWFWIERLLDVAFAVDILFNFFTAYEKDGRFVNNPNAIRSRYLATWFLPDLLSTFPWDTLALSIEVDKSKPHLLQLPRFIRLVRLFKLFRIMRIMRLKQNFTKLEVKLQLKYGYVRLASLMVTVLLIAHWFACLFYYFGSVASSENSWTTQPDIPHDIYGRYIAALYFSVYTITTIGYGDIVPENTLERTYTTVIMFLGAACFAYVISQVSNIAGELNASSVHHRIMMDSLTDLAKSRQLPDQLVFDIRRFFQREHLRQRVAAESELLQGMSKDLRVEVLKHIYGTHLETCRLFKDVPNDHLHGVYEDLNEKFARKDETLYTEDDSPDCFYIIIKGKVELTKLGEEPVLLSDGDIFGDDDIVFNRLRRATAVCTMYSDVVMVPRQAAIEVLKRHERALKKLRDQEALWLWDQAMALVEQQIRFGRMAELLRSRGEEHMVKKGVIVKSKEMKATPMVRSVVSVPVARGLRKDGLGQQNNSQGNRDMIERFGGKVDSLDGMKHALEAKSKYIAQLEQRLSALHDQLNGIVGALKQEG